MDKPSQHSNYVPTAIDVERVVLARALTTTEKALELLSQAQETYFWNYTHRLIFLALKDIVNQGGTPDITTVNNYLTTSGKDPGLVKLTDLSDLISAAYERHAGIKQLVAILQKAAIEREVLHLVYQTQQHIAEGKQDVLPELINNLLKLNSGATSKTLFDAKELTAEHFDILAAREKNGGVAGIPFGYSDLDRATTGAKPGQLIVIAGRTSQGKSAFSENIITNMLKRGVKVYFASAETGREEIMDRLLGRMTGLGHTALMHGLSTNGPNADLVNKALAQVHEFPLFLQDNPNITSDQILAEATRLKLQGKLDIVFVDYLQFLKDKSASGENRERTIARISQNLKSIARSLNVPVVVTAQLNREAAGVNSRPELHHLRDSGQIEQDADVAILLWRGDEEKEPGITHFDIAKNRSGRTGEFDLQFNGATVEFQNKSPKPLPRTTPHYVQG